MCKYDLCIIQITCKKIIDLWFIEAFCKNVLFMFYSHQQGDKQCKGVFLS